MKHGIYIISEDHLEQFENSWFDGQQIDLVSTTYTLGMFDAAGITWAPGAGAQNTKQSLQKTFGESDRRLLTTYKFSGDPPSDYGPASRGDLSDRYRSFAKELVSLGLEDTIITPNHEFNLSWSKRYPSDPQNYADGYARLVSAMQSVDGANFTFCFAPSSNRQGIAPEAWPVDSQHWPSGEDPPIVTPSVYDNSNSIYPDDPDKVTDEQRKEVWNDHHEPVLEMWNTFANERNSDMGFREWGMASDAYKHNGGIDNPIFIDRFFDWIESHDVAFQTYWNGGIDNPKHTIWPRDKSRLPEGSKRWQERVAATLETDSGTDDTTDGSTDTNALGGYNTPSQGTLNWNVPLNENFKDIEEDIKTLDERLKNLE